MKERMSDPTSTVRSTISIVLNVVFFCISYPLIGHYISVERLVEGLGIFCFASFCLLVSAIVRGFPPALLSVLLYVFVCEFRLAGWCLLSLGAGARGLSSSACLYCMLRGEPDSSTFIVNALLPSALGGISWSPKVCKSRIPL